MAPVALLTLFPCIAHAVPPAALPPIAVYGTWSVQCPQTSDRGGYCEIVQQVREATGSGRPVLQFALSCMAAQQRCAVQIGLPPSLGAGQATLLSLDTTLPWELSVHSCDRLRCSGGGMLPFAFGEELVRAKRIRLQFRDQRAGRQEIVLGVEGLTQAFADMIARNAGMAANAGTPSYGEGKTR